MAIIRAGADKNNVSGLRTLTIWPLKNKLITFGANIKTTSINR
jgi:hypothetical protein